MNVRAVKTGGKTDKLKANQCTASLAAVADALYAVGFNGLVFCNKEGNYFVNL